MRFYAATQGNEWDRLETEAQHNSGDISEQ